jgi:hypothetical protein
VRQIAEDTDINLGEIGTSSEHLNELEKKGYLAQARKLLDRLREAKSEDIMKYTHSWDTEFIRVYLLVRAEAEFEAIGTTKEEIMDLERLALLAGMKHHLKLARSLVDFESISDHINFILNVSSREGISLEEAGTNLKEIEMLQRLSMKD